MKIAVRRIVNAVVMIVILISAVNFDCKDENITSNTSNICRGLVRCAPLSVRGDYYFQWETLIDRVLKLLQWTCAACSEFDNGAVTMYVAMENVNTCFSNPKIYPAIYASVPQYTQRPTQRILVKLLTVCSDELAKRCFL